jgi:hypothetical protein
LAISYTLDLATPEPPAQVAAEIHWLALGIGLLLDSTPAARVLEGVVTASGTWLRVIAAPRPRPADPVVTSFGFRPTVSALFRFDELSDPDLQGDDMIQLVSGLLTHVPGDLVLHREHEGVWLLRRGDDLTISDRDDLWPPHRVALLAHPHRRSPLAFRG